VSPRFLKKTRILHDFLLLVRLLAESQTYFSCGGPQAINRHVKARTPGVIS